MQNDWIKIIEEFSNKAVPPEDDKHLQQDLGLDSLGMAQLMTALEEHGITVHDPQLLKTVGDVKRLAENAQYKEDPENSGWRDRLRGPSRQRLEDLFNEHWTHSEVLFTNGARWLFNRCFNFLHSLEVHGIEKLPSGSPYLLCPNHQSYPDPLFLYARLPREHLERMLFVGWGGYFRKPPFSWLNKVGRVLPTGGPGRHPECLKLAYDGLMRGMSVCIFPEGGRTSTRSLMKPRLGAGILAYEAGVPIYPVRLEGALESLSWLRRGVHFCKIQMWILDPIEPHRNGPGSIEDYRRLMHRWKAAIEP